VLHAVARNFPDPHSQNSITKLKIKNEKYECGYKKLREDHAPEPGKTRKGEIGKKD